MTVSVVVQDRERARDASDRYHVSRVYRSFAAVHRPTSADSATSSRRSVPLPGRHTQFSLCLSLSVSLDALFLYLAVTALHCNQLFERIMLLVTEQVRPSVLADLIHVSSEIRRVQTRLMSFHP